MFNNASRAWWKCLIRAILRNAFSRSCVENLTENTASISNLVAELQDEFLSRLSLSIPSTLRNVRAGIQWGHTCVKSSRQPGLQLRLRSASHWERMQAQINGFPTSALHHKGKKMKYPESESQRCGSGLWWSRPMINIVHLINIHWVLPELYGYKRLFLGRQKMEKTSPRCSSSLAWERTLRLSRTVRHMRIRGSRLVQQGLGWWRSQPAAPTHPRTQFCGQKSKQSIFGSITFRGSSVQSNHSCQGTFNFKGSNMFFSFVCHFSRTQGTSRAAHSSQDWGSWRRAPAWIPFSDSPRWPRT